MTIAADRDRTADRDRALARLYWTALALAVITGVYSILSARGLVYDGCYYLLGVAGHRTFQLIEPARTTVQILQQCLAVAGARLGIHDLWTLGVLFSAGASGWPLILTALCWFVLPRGNKSWIAGPLLNLVLAIPATSFIGIGEGIIASCLLWLAFLLIEFRMDKPAGALACVCATAACAFSQESAILCLLVIAAAAGFRISDTKGFCRLAALATTLLAAAAAANMLRWILFPRSTIERGDFFVSMLGGFVGSPAAPNIPVLASLVAAAAVVAVLRGRKTVARTCAAVAIAIIAGLLVLLLADPDNMLAPSRYFAARGLPVALTTVLAAFFLLLKRRRQTPARFATSPVLAIILALAATQAAAQGMMTYQWNSYLQALRRMVAVQDGVISHAQAMARLDPRGTRFRRQLLEHWSVEPLSIQLAPRGQVQALVEPAPKARWVPYDPHNPSTLPQAQGLDWSQFVPRSGHVSSGCPLSHECP
jgi:hypothetical protein